MLTYESNMQRKKRKKSLRGKRTKLVIEQMFSDYKEEGGEKKQ